MARQWLEVQNRRVSVGRAMAMVAHRAIALRVVVDAHGVATLARRRPSDGGNRLIRSARWPVRAVSNGAGVLAAKGLKRIPGRRPVVARQMPHRRQPRMAYRAGCCLLQRARRSSSAQRPAPPRRGTCRQKSPIALFLSFGGDSRGAANNRAARSLGGSKAVVHVRPCVVVAHAAVMTKRQNRCELAGIEGGKGKRDRKGAVTMRAISVGAARRRASCGREMKAGIRRPVLVAPPRYHQLRWRRRRRGGEYSL